MPPVALLIALLLTQRPLPPAVLLTSPLPSAEALAAHTRQQGPTVEFHAADSVIGYDWFTYVPATLRPGERAFIWVTGLHGNLVIDDYASITAESRRMAQSRAVGAEEHRLAMLVPVIPRPRTNHVYAIAFAPGVFMSSADAPVHRPDLKLNAMIDRFARELRAGGYDVEPRVLLDGFSAGGMFAQRYALLHPGRVLALAVGQCGGALTLPVAYLEPESSGRLDWPVGIGDYEGLVGWSFDDAAYRRIAQFVFVGAQDTSNSTLARVGELWRTQNQVDVLNRVFGRTDPTRLESEARYLRGLGYDVTFRQYAATGHTMTQQMRTDVFAFLDSARTRN